MTYENQELLPDEKLYSSVLIIIPPPPLTPSPQQKAEEAVQ